MVAIVDPKKNKYHTNRPPVPFTCDCGRKEVIVLPVARGVLVFKCRCGAEWQIKFLEDRGELRKVI
jgi:hypothetical protein